MYLKKEVSARVRRGIEVRKRMLECLKQMGDDRLKTEAAILYQLTFLHDRSEQFSLILRNDDISNSKAKETLEYLCMVNEGLKAYLTDLGIYEEDE